MRGTARVQENSGRREDHCLQGPTQGYICLRTAGIKAHEHPCTLAYQTEIDNLTKRSKTSENAFLNVYKALAEAPDPYPLLEGAVV
jgi:hypothetical protein